MAGGFSGFRGDEGQLAGCREKRLDGYAQPREDLFGSKHRSVIWSAKDGDDAAHADEGSGGLGALIRGLVHSAFNDVSQIVSFALCCDLFGCFHHDPNDGFGATCTYENSTGVT